MFRRKKEKQEVVTEENVILKDEQDEITDMECAVILASEVEKNINRILKEESNITFGFGQVSNTLAKTTDEIGNIEQSLYKLDTDTANILNEISSSIKNSQNRIQYSREKVDNSTVHMKDVFGVFEHILEVSVAMERKYEEINEFANAITNIASQTDLLSLNASIEAARAGETGKGFAVVASEIKSLSETTQKSASDIIRLLDEMSGIMNSLRGESDKGKEIVTVANNAMNNSSESFNHIEDAEKQVNAKLEIMKNSQLHNINEIASNLSSIVEQSTMENKNIDDLILNVEKKAHFYMDIMNQLDQIKKLRE